MKFIQRLICFCLLITFISCNSSNKSNETSTSTKDSAVATIELYDSSANEAINKNASIQVIGSGFKWVEGPVWIPQQQMLLFSDVPNNKIYKWTQADSTQLFLSPAGYTGTAPHEGEIGSNGLTLDNKGRLLLCQDGDRQIGRLNASFDSPKASYTTITSNYNGKKFNSPNDIIVSSNGTIYFTDPIYGLPKGADDPLREIKFEGVFKVDSNGKTTLLIDSISRPNGIALSNDEKILYVASSDDAHSKWYAYDLNDEGNVTSGKILLDATEMKAKAKVQQGCDGFKVDKHGNIFAAGPDGVNIISPAGKLIGLIRVYNKRASNCAFNETKDVLYVTATDMVLKIKLH
ncbi:MAG: SMP-30/gluconolactonase/LRE family protein [Parafilimonas sp.]